LSQARWSTRDTWAKAVLALALVLVLAGLAGGAATSGGARVPEPAAARRDRVRVVTATPGLVAFWDFVEREPAGQRRFTAHVPAGATNDYPLDAGNYVKDFWGQGREAGYGDFPLLGRGPFGQAIRIRAETDPTLRPLLFVPRARLEGSPLDVKGARSVSVVVWAIRESGNHALAGIWHEGTDLREESTRGIQRVERGQRQYALFAGLSKEGSACGHVSDNGGSSFGYKYALHKSNSGEVSPAVPADAPPEVLDGAWQCFAMTFDNQRDEITGWLNGRATARWQEDVATELPPVYDAWKRGEYAPPEERPSRVEVLADTPDERVERREYRYTRVKVTLRRDAGGAFSVAARDLEAVRINPWWFPHDIYTPPPGAGGPFTIGRVIHSARSVGFTGWIGGVAVFDRALTADELARLCRAGQQRPIRVP
jgi:hypothetical protein